MMSVLLYDGECGFCSSMVSLVLRHERRHSLRFAALQSPLAAEVVRQRPALKDLDTVVWVDVDDANLVLDVRTRSAAALRVCGYLGGWWRLLQATWIVPQPLRDVVYDLVARNRHRLLRNSACDLPSGEQRSRFVQEIDELMPVNQRT